MIVCVPSKGRAGKAKTMRVIPSATLFVPEIEVRSYEAAYSSSPVVGVPASVRGITATRNWILDHVNDTDVVMIDDDVKAAGYIELHEEYVTHERMSEAIWLREFAKLFDVSRGFNTRIWGVATQSAPRSVYPYKPFLWRSYVTGSLIGICNETGIRFDESFKVKEDYELTLRCIVEDGAVTAARYLYWENSHWHDEGGCKDYRTREMESLAIARLMRMYPGMIRQITRGRSDYSIELTL